MLQTMMFIAYLLIGALVFAKVEGWEYLNAVYWADVTLLTVGLGSDYTPKTNTGRGLLFPFAIGGIITIGLVVGSIRSLVLERGKEKLSARITEKRREGAIQNVDERKQTIKISYFASADFSTDPALSRAQRREEEFHVMRKVRLASNAAYLTTNVSRRCKTRQNENVDGLHWQVLPSSLYCCGLSALPFSWSPSKTSNGLTSMACTSPTFAFSPLDTEVSTTSDHCQDFVSLTEHLDFIPMSNSGHAFFVFWSLLAIPALTILISNMGDTIVQWFSDITLWIGSVTVLPGEQGARATMKSLASEWASMTSNAFKHWSPPGLAGDVPPGHTMHHEKRLNATDHENRMMDRLAERLSDHMDMHEEGLKYGHASSGHDEIESDMNFYHYILAREVRNMMKDLSASPPKKYSWEDWEYFLKLMGNEEDPEDYPGQKVPDIMVPAPLMAAPSEGTTGSDATMTDGAVDRDEEVQEWKKAHEANKHLRRHPERRRRHNTAMDLQDWSWMSSKSPLMSTKSEAEWILERLGAALERELNRQRKGYRKKPPISLSDIRRKGDNQGGDSAARKEASNVEKAARSEA